jgi:hypothetical protein
MLRDPEAVLSISRDLERQRAEAERAAHAAPPMPMDMMKALLADSDVASLIMEQLGLADGLAMARICKTWRASSREVWGRAQFLGRTALFVGDGKVGNALGQFELPVDVKILPRGDVCVVDGSWAADRRRFQILSADLEPLREVPCAAPQIYGRGNGGGYDLMAVAASPDALFAACYSSGDPGHSAILFKYRLRDFEVLEELESSYEVNPPEDEDDEDDCGEWDEYFAAPADLLVVSDQLYLCDRGGECGSPSVVVFDLDLQHLFTFGIARHRADAFFDSERRFVIPAKKKGVLLGPEALTSKDGLIYVADTVADRVKVFDLHGNFQRVVLCNRKPFVAPISIAFARGRLLVGEGTSSSHGRRVKVLTPDGVLLQTVELSFSPASLCVHEAKDRVYAAYAGYDLHGKGGGQLQVLSIRR